MKNYQFYNSASEYYDEMISLSTSIKRRMELFKQIISPEMKDAADLGCGTGVDSIALSILGVNVTAFDPSEQMIDKAKSNAEKSGVNIDFNVSRIDRISLDCNDHFDLVVSLGNTFANIRREHFKTSVVKCFNLLKPAGIIIIHILNYKKILKEQNRIVNITGVNDKQFIRFYDFRKESINFNILSYSLSNTSDQKLITTEIFPHTKEDFENVMLNSGFKQIDFFSTLRFDSFNPESSKDIFIRASMV